MIQSLRSGFGMWIGFFLIILATTFFSSPATAQLTDPFPPEAWHRVYDYAGFHDGGLGVAIDSGYNVIVVGYRGTESPPASGDYWHGEGYNAYAIKYDQRGNVHCDREVKGPGLPAYPSQREATDYFWNVAVDSQDNLVIAGSISGDYYGAQSYWVGAYLNKYDGECNPVWAAPVVYKYPDDSAWQSMYSVTTDGSDNIFTTGAVFGNWGPIQHEWATWKYNGDGVLQPGFPFFYNYSNEYQYADYSYDLAVDKLGNIVVVGSIGQALNNLDWHVRKYNSAGLLLWSDTFGESVNLADYAHRVAIDSQNNPIVVGYTNKGTDNGAGANYDWRIVKYAAEGVGGAGQRLWNKTFESAPGRSESAHGVAVDANDNIIVAGVKRIDAGNLNLRLALLDKDTGDEIGERIITDPANVVPYRIRYRNGAIAIGGYVWDPAGLNNNIYTALLQAPAPIEPVAPSNGITFDACSYFEPPAFTWTLNQTFQKLELRFYTMASAAKPTRVKVKDPAATQVLMPAKTWSKILKLPGLSGGELNWKIVGTNKGQPVVESDVFTMTIAGPAPVQNPDISPVNQDSLPTLSWGNSCATKFKVYIGSATPDPKIKKLAFTDQNPLDNGGVFSTILTDKTWNAIRKLVDYEAGFPMFFYVESWDALKRYQKSDEVLFNLGP